MRKLLGNSSTTNSGVVRKSPAGRRARFTALSALLALIAAGLLHLAPGGNAQTPPEAGNISVARRSHTATLLADGKVLIAGGENSGGPVSGSEIFDPASKAVSHAANLSGARSGHTATRLSDGRVLVTGGKNQAGRLASTEIFDPATGSFVDGPSLNRARHGHSATALADGRILVAGGDAEGSAEVFSSETQSFTLVEGRMSAPRGGHSALLLRNGKVFVAGGSAANGDSVRSGEIFDVSTMSFSAAGNLMANLKARTRPTLRELPDGKVQVVGGNTKGSMEIYVPAGDTAQSYFSAKAQIIPSSNPLSDILGTQTRAALFYEGSAQSGAPAGLLDREEYTITEIPRSNQALVVGGVNSLGQVLNSTSLLSSSPTTVTTDKVEYIPGEKVTITGTNWRAGETVTLVLSRNSVINGDTTLTSVADANGEFTNTDFVPEQTDEGIAFTMTAKGQSSGFTTQTTFLDARLKTRPSVASIARTFGTPTAALRAALNEEYKTGLGAAVSGRQFSFILNGIAVPGTFSTDIDGVAVTTPLNLADYGVINAGTYTIEANFAGDDFYLRSTGTASFSMGKATPTIIWNVPADITYPTAVSATQHNAAATNSLSGAPVAGTFAYTPAAGTVLEPGTRSLSATFTPTDTANYFGVTAFNTLNVLKTTPDIAWNAPADITYPAALGAAQLNATASSNGSPLAGTFTYTPAAGAVLNAGANTLSARFTPTDAAHYKAVTVTVPLNVLKASLSVTADNKSRIYGATNPEFTGTIAGVVGGDQITANYTTDAAQASAVGTYPIRPTLIDPANRLLNYNVTSSDGTLTVGKAPLVVTAADASRLYGAANPEFTGSVTGVVGGDQITAAYATSATPGSPVGAYAIVPTLSGANAELSNYDVTSNNGTLTVGKAALTVTAEDKSKTYGSDNPEFTASYAGFVNNEGASVLGGTLGFGTQADASSPVGTYPVTPGGLDSPNYELSFVSGVLTVTRAVPTINWGNPANIAYGTPLGDAQLNAAATLNGAPVAGTFTYTPATGTVLAPGATQTLSVSFAPADADNFSNASAGVSINVTNQAPVADAQTPATNEDAGIAIALTGSDADGNRLTYSLVSGASNGTLSGTVPNLTYTPNANFNGTDSITFKVSDGYSDSDVATVSIRVSAVNDAPAVGAGGPYQVAEGGSVVVAASGSDIEDATLTYEWDLDNNGSFETAGQSVTFSAAGLNGPVSRTVGVRATDGGGLSVTSQAIVNVVNAAPTVGTISAPADALKMGTAVNTFSAKFSDAGVADTHTATWNWGDGSTSPGTVSEVNGSGSASGSHTYAAAGIYTVAVTVTDKDGASVQSVFRYVVIYDPARSESGKGSINSPAGAYTRDTSLVSTADFSFSASYGRNATTPTGRESFSFTAAGLNFTGESYKWLVVSGANGWLMGTGTLTTNGVTETCQFLLTVVDGQVAGGGGVDKFRMKIWNDSGIIYDNQMGAADDAVATHVVSSSASNSVTIR